MHPRSLPMLAKLQKNLCCDNTAMQIFFYFLTFLGSICRSLFYALIISCHSINGYQKFTFRAR